MRSEMFERFFIRQHPILLMELHDCHSILEVVVVRLISIVFFRINKNLILASGSPPPRPPLPSDEELSATPAPRRPPLPDLEPTDEESYDKDLPIPQSNQPILVCFQKKRN